MPLCYFPEDGKHIYQVAAESPVCPRAITQHDRCGTLPVVSLIPIEHRLPIPACLPLAPASRHQRLDRGLLLRSQASCPRSGRLYPSIPSSTLQRSIQRFRPQGLRHHCHQALQRYCLPSCSNNCPVSFSEILNDSESLSPQNPRYIDIHRYSCQSHFHYDSTALASFLHSGRCIASSQPSQSTCVCDPLRSE